jgi:hypothetical protein
MAVWLLVGLFALVAATGCRGSVSAAAAVPAVDSQGTISGTVRGLERALPVAGRSIAIIDVATGQRRVIQTSSTGGFSVEVPTGRYRVELPLRDGEMLVQRPDVVEVEHASGGSHVELVLATARVLRPRGPAYRLDNGLGSPIA